MNIIRFNTLLGILLLSCALVYGQAVTMDERPAFVKSHGEQKLSKPRTHVFKYTNPITKDTSKSMRDYFIIKVGKKWYATGTSLPVWSGHNPGVRLLVSDDLIHWKQQAWLINGSKLADDCPYNGRFWAPEIHYIRNKYWLTVNSGKVTQEDPKGMKTHSVWLFSADKVTGPYKLVNGPLTPQYNNDATLFEDEDGQTYLYCSGNGLFQAKIDLPRGKLIGELQKFRNATDKENPKWMWGGIEGPFVLKREGIYYMFFSTWTRGYEVGLLRSRSPLGPWELASPEPIFGTRKAIYRGAGARVAGEFNDTKDPYAETGHNAIFEGPDGKLWSSCHYMIFDGKTFKSSDEGNLPKGHLGIEPLYFRNGIFTIDGPTWTEQAVKY
ncbi:family 43 glycosylhydrolase [Mucilaginibacter sp. CSA2-8R]|uniref:glycoside hydrolase family 43 protein n=1 Tax=Mucilaginibacter sp. CSA2-8R TaxID=3141542 RepID=UPI00315CE6D7